MASPEGADADKDWRLQAQLIGAEPHERLRSLLARLREPTGVGDDVVVTHDGDTLYGYAASESAIRAARAALEVALGPENTEASIRISHWDDARQEWRQVEPAPSDVAREVIAREDRANDAVETRTLVATAGKLVRADFEQSMSAWAKKLDLQCEIVEHPHLLTTQVAFTVTGAKDRVDEFAQGLRAEGRTYVRTETGVMLNPI